VEIAEDFLGPKIDAAFTGKAVCEFDDGNALRQEEEQQRDNPEPDGDAAVGRDRRQDVEIENRDDEQEHEVALPEHALEMRLFGRANGRYNLGGQKRCSLKNEERSASESGPYKAG